MNKILDTIAGIADRHSRAIMILAGIWFWAGIAIYAGFIELPYISEAAKMGFFWIGVGANALWWGYFYGEITKRRKALSSSTNQTPEINDDNQRR